MLLVSLADQSKAAPTVNTALILLLSHPKLEETRSITYACQDQVPHISRHHQWNKYQKWTSSTILLHLTRNMFHWSKTKVKLQASTSSSFHRHIDWGLRSSDVRLVIEDAFLVEFLFWTIFIQGWVHLWLVLSKWGEDARFSSIMYGLKQVSNFSWSNFIRT